MSTDVGLVEMAASKGWPAGLLQRALAARTPRRTLDFWLSAHGPHKTFDIERLLDVVERSDAGDLRVHEVTIWDHDSFSELWSRSPEAIGEWEITVERGPNAFAQFHLQGGASVTVVDQGGEVVACTVWSPARVEIAGRRQSIHFAQGMRVRDDQRRKGLADVVRRYPRRALQRPTMGQVMFMRIGNDGISAFLEKVGFQADTVRAQQLVTVTHLTATPQIPLEGVRPATVDDLPVCAAMINRTHAGRDLFGPIGAEGLAEHFDLGDCHDKPAWWQDIYLIGDLRVVERDGQIIACAGMWDRGRDLRERWRHAVTAEIRYHEGTALLDFGCQAGNEDILAALVRHLVGETHALGRTALAAPLEGLPAVLAKLADLDRREETRILEWSPESPALPPALQDVFIDLRFW